MSGGRLPKDPINFMEPPLESNRKPDASRHLAKCRYIGAENPDHETALLLKIPTDGIAEFSERYIRVGM